ncbi:MAG TPA: CPBP family intramembrane glutamic endopeptidase [Candidatus Acidoferrum sp.]|nr:CPBP family intramembrane glutamic endopeptidase [Candidatus Acidoferrum sp.]
MNQIFSIRRLATHPAGIKGLLPQLALKVFPQDGAERLVFFALVCTVAVCEELIYRGFVQHVAQEFGPDSLMWGIVVSSVFFAFAHLYQGGRGLLSTFLVGVVFASVRFWTGSLLPTISAHFVADLTVGLLAPGRLRAALAAQPADPVSPAASAEDNPS